MTYWRRLALGWSRRDRLAVLVIAVAVAFLVGCVLVISAIGASGIQMADTYDTDGTAAITDWDGETDASSDRVLLPVATAERPDGTRAPVVGVPSEAPRGESNLWEALPDPPNDQDGPAAAIAQPPEVNQVELIGGEATVRASVEQRPRESLILDSWYVTTTDTVTQLGPEYALALEPTTEPAANPATGTPIPSILVFFVAGLEQLQRVIGLVLAGAAVLVGVTVAGMTRTTIHDRAETIGVIRATGAAPRAVVSALSAKAALLTGFAVVLGCAVGIIVTNAAVTVGIALGVPSGLDIQLTPQRTVMVSGIGLVIWLVGSAVGMFTARQAVSESPTTLLRSTTATGLLPDSRYWILEKLGLSTPGGSSPESERGSRGRSTPLLVGWDMLVPSVATLTVAAAVILLVGSFAVTATPLLMASGSTVTQSNVPHPITSNVPLSSADAFEAAGYEASPEILAFTVTDGDPVIVRGVRFEPFTNITGARLTDGEPPSATAEAVIGEPVARRLEVDIGDRVVLGGSTQTRVASVTVVGTYDAPGGLSNSILVSLDSARGLVGTHPGNVQLIRLDARLDATSDTSVVADVEIPGRVPENSTVEASVRIHNLGTEKQEYTVTAEFRDHRRTNTSVIPAGESASVTVSLPSGSPGEAVLRLEHANGTTSETVTVVDEATPQIRGLPSRAPPNSTPRVRVVNVRSEPLGNTTVRVANDTVRTAANGTVRLPPLPEGTHTVMATHEGFTTDESVTVVAGTPRQPYVELAVSPEMPSVVTRPTVTVRLSNPWATTIEWPLEIAWTGGTREERVRLAPGGQTARTFELPRQPPGPNEIVLHVNGSVLATERIDVQGDERLASALASNGRTTEASGIARALEVVMGNLYTAFGALLALAGLMTVGALVASLSGTLYDRRRTVGVLRATGADRRRILWLIGRDVARVGCLSAVIAGLCATAVLWMLGRAGLLTVFGIGLGGNIRVEFVLLAMLGGVTLTLLAATTVAIRLCRVEPAALLSDDGHLMGDRDA